MGVKKVDLTNMSIPELNEYAIASKKVCDELVNDANINSTDQYGHKTYDNSTMLELNKYKHINYLITEAIKNKLLDILKTNE